MAGVLNTGQQIQQRALGGILRSSAMEQQREATNRQIEAQETTQKIGSTMSGAAIGAMIGSSSYPVIGTIVGAAIGYLVSEVF